MDGASLFLGGGGQFADSQPLAVSTIVKHEAFSAQSFVILLLTTVTVFSQIHRVQRLETCKHSSR